MASLDIGGVAFIKQRVHHARQRHVRQDQELAAVAVGTGHVASVPNKMLQPKAVGSVLLGKDRILKVCSSYCE